MDDQPAFEVQVSVTIVPSIRTSTRRGKAEGSPLAMNEYVAVWVVTVFLAGLIPLGVDLVLGARHTTEGLVDILVKGGGPLIIAGVIAAGSAGELYLARLRRPKTHRGIKTWLCWITAGFSATAGIGYALARQTEVSAHLLHLSCVVCVGLALVLGLWGRCLTAREDR